MCASSAVAINLLVLFSDFSYHTFCVCILFLLDLVPFFSFASIWMWRCYFCFFHRKKLLEIRAHPWEPNCVVGIKFIFFVPFLSLQWKIDVNANTKRQKKQRKIRQQRRQKWCSKKMDKTLRHFLQNKEYKLIKNSKHVLERTNGKISQHDQDHKNVAYHWRKQRSKLKAFLWILVSTFTIRSINMYTTHY